MDCLYRIGVQPIFINRVWIPATQKMKARCDTQDDATIKNHRWTLLRWTGRTHILYTHAVYSFRCILPGCRKCRHSNLGRECLQWPLGWCRPLRWSLLRLQWPSLISRMLVSLLSTRPVERNLLGNVNRWTLGVVSIVWHYTKIQNAQVEEQSSSSVTKTGYASTSTLAWPTLTLPVVPMIMIASYDSGYAMIIYTSLISLSPIWL